MNRTIRLNRVHLAPRKGKECAELLFWGDWHFGHPCVDSERALANLQYCLENGIYVLGMGDYLEAGTRTSVGDSVYMQEGNPQEQMDAVEAALEPLAKAGLLIGLHTGNHEGRILKDTSIDVVKMMAKSLRVPYLGYACWSILYVGDESYTLYSLHGTSSARFVYTKVKSLMDISHGFEADIMAMGHTHALSHEVSYVQRVNRTRKTVDERKKDIILTGGYLGYDNSYAQMKGYPPVKLGSPKIKLFAKKHDTHVST